MKVKSAKSVTRVEANNLNSKEQPEHYQVTYDENDNLQGVSWLWGTDDNGLRPMVKRQGGVWNKSAGGWTFGDSSIAESFLEQIIKRHPDWPILGHPHQPYKPFARVKFSRLHLNNGIEACLIPFPIPYFANLTWKHDIFRLQGAKKNEEACLIVGSSADIAIGVDSMTQQGAKCDDTLAIKWSFDSCFNSKLQVKVTGWAVQVTCDLSNPLHYLAAPELKYRWEGYYPFGVKVAIPWKGTIHSTRKLWPTLKAKIQAAGLEWEGDDPEQELTVPAAFNPGRVAGWEYPAPNGHLLHKYQKEGASFCASRGMRALIGDEMGVGKTVQAIAAAEAVDAKKVLIICPANARYVWDREIQGWGGQGAIQHIISQTDQLDMNARWHIVTYDLIASRAETWRLNDEVEEKAFVDAFPDLVETIQKPKKGDYPRKVTLEQPLNGLPEFNDPKRVAAWEKMMRRLRGELLEQFLLADQMLVILDEAHRVKNKSTKRTKAIQRLSVSHKQMLMLTGTPLRNNEHEAAVLLGLLDAEAADALNKEQGYTIQDIKDYLSHFMIRRTKTEVLPELPAKTRQRIDIDNLDAGQMGIYHEVMDLAREHYEDAINNNASAAQARQSMQGCIEKARAVLGLAKVGGGEVADLVIDVVENKGCCVVFCAHQAVSDELMRQLEKEKLRVAVVDGRTTPRGRAQIVESFQAGRLDVFIGGINAAGEAITLTRADTVVFVELDWVPAALLQAEDRIHRVGQRSNCQVIQLVARMPGGDNLDEIMVDLIGSKLARIGTVLDEDTSNIIPGSIQMELQERLLGTIRPVARTVGINEQLAVISDAQEVIADRPIEPETIVVETVEKTKHRRGRPKVYIDKAPSMVMESSRHSNKALVDADEKRVMLRLTPEAHDALKIILELTGAKQETAAINQAILAWKQDLQNASTKSKSTTKYA